METGTPIGTEQTVELLVEPEAQPASEPTTPGPRRLSRAMAWLDRQPMFIYSLVAALAGILGRLPVAVVVGLLRVPQTQAELQPIHGADETFVGVMFWVLVVAPLVETLLNQSLIIGLMSRWVTKKVWPQIIVSAIIFALSHLPRLHQAIAALVPGLALGYVYLTWFRRGRHQGYWATVLTHAWTNLIATGIGVALGAGWRQ
jgi:membrane protease YdiL (CAAX protease family)